MALWDITLYNNTLSSKSSNVVPCCTSVAAKERFLNSIEKVVPAEDIYIQTPNNYINSDLDTLVIELDQNKNPNCFKANYVKIETRSIGNIALRQYYWIDHVRYIHPVKTDGSGPASSGTLVAELHLSKDIWMSEFFRENWKPNGWELVMPKISKFIVERTTHPAVLNAFPNRAPNPGVDYSLSLPYQDYQLSGNKLRPIVIYTLSTKATNSPYSSYLVLYGKDTYDITTSNGRRDAINEILILNNPGEVLNIQLPPEYGEVLNWTYIVAVKAYLIPNDLIPQMFYGYPLDYTAQVRYSIGTSTYTRQMGVGARSITNKRELSPPTAHSYDSFFPIEVGTLTNRLQISPSVEVLTPGDWGKTLPSFRYKHGKIIMEISLYGDTLSLLLTTQDGSTLNIAEDFQIPYSLTDEGQRASERASQAELNAVLGILTTIVSLGATVATGGAAAPLALATGTAGLVSGVQGAQNAAEQKELSRRIPGIKGNAPGRFFSAIKGIYIRYYQSDTYYGLNTKTLFDVSGSECYIVLDDYDIQGSPSSRDIFTKPYNSQNTTSKPYAYIRGQIYAQGMAENYLTEISTRIAQGIYFIYF